jgi:hypothetical protein
MSQDLRPLSRSDYGVCTVDAPYNGPQHRERRGLHTEEFFNPRTQAFEK